MEYKVGQVLNSKGSSLYGILIRWRNSWMYGKENNWAHSAIISDVKDDEIVIHEALSKGFVATCYERKEFEEKVKEGHFVIGKTKKPIKDVKKHVKKYEGRGYGFFDIFNIILYGLFGTEAKFLFTHAKYLICSEAVARILYDASNEKIDFQKEFEIPYDLIEPMHLWQSEQIDWFKG